MNNDDLKKKFTDKANPESSESGKTANDLMKQLGFELDSEGNPTADSIMDFLFDAINIVDEDEEEEDEISDDGEYGAVPVICLRGMVAYPMTDFTFEIGREKSKISLERATKQGNVLFLVAQRDETIENPEEEDLYRSGIYARIMHTIPHGDGEVISVSVSGIYRATPESFEEVDGCTMCLAKRCDDYPAVSDGKRTPAYVDQNRQDAYRARLKETYLKYAYYRSQLSDGRFDLIDYDEFMTSFENLAYNIAMRLPIEVQTAQKILESRFPASRIELILSFLYSENERLELEAEINNRVQDSIDKNNKEYFLHETINQIHKELGEDNYESDIDEYKRQLDELKIDESIKKKITKEINRLNQTQPMSPDSAVIRGYVEKVLELPWNSYTRDNLDIKHVKKILDQDHYGLEEVKESVLEALTAYRYSKDMSGQIICLVGPPGVGKTSIASSVARAMGRKFARVSLGGIRDEAEIRGHRKTYVGSMPGRIINALIECDTKNPVILLDEVDKLSSDYKGDPSSALLEVLDPEQNRTFTDHYIDLPFDLSNVLFITTANDRDSIPGPLLDRMDIIELGSYTVAEKEQIAKKHLIKRLFKKYGLTTDNLKINTKAVDTVIEKYTREAGVRELERLLDKIIRKFLMERSEIVEPMSVTQEKIVEYLGREKFLKETKSEADEVGVVNGLAWTSVGGEVLKIECRVFDGTGKLELTGSLGDVMKESAKIAVSVARGLSEKYGYDKDFYKNKDIHLHFPDGATKKDGPSAGVAIVTALVSALSGLPVSADVAVTGEGDINGNVLPIGGLKEKTMAAYRYNVGKCVIPRKNEPDMEKVNDVVKEKIEFTLVDKIDDALEILIPKK